MKLAIDKLKSELSIIIHRKNELASILDKVNDGKSIQYKQALLKMFDRDRKELERAINVLKVANILDE